MRPDRRLHHVDDDVAAVDQHPFGGDQTQLRIAGRPGRSLVKLLTRIQQREEIESISEDRLHFFGSPLM